MTAFGGYHLRFTGHSKQGDRKYMEDCFIVSYQPKADERGRESADNLEYSYYGVFDGHGGFEAANFAKNHLMAAIVREGNFWSERDEDVLKAIRDGFINTHMAMWNEQEKWPKTASGLPSTAGTTASIAFLRRGKIYTGHVGDSGIVLGYQQPGSTIWEAQRLTRDHKPDNPSELMRIKQSGGKVVAKSGVPRVVWYRPQLGHKGPITRSTPFDEIPFLAVARSLGDLWSYNSANNEFVVSPEPDTNVIPIDMTTFRCLVFGSDGLWNMVSPSAAVSLVQAAEQNNAVSGLTNGPRINPSVSLVERALERWSSSRMRADNTTVVTLILDPVEPPRPHSRLSAPELHQYETYRQEATREDTTSPSNAANQERLCSKSRYTEEYLDQIHSQLTHETFLDTSSELSYADSTQSTALTERTDSTESVRADKTNTMFTSEGTIQINVVSSSSDSGGKKVALLESYPGKTNRCSRSLSEVEFSESVVHSCPNMSHRRLRSQSAEPGHSQHCSSTIILKKTTSKTSISDSKLTRSRSLGSEVSQIIRTKGIVRSCPSTPQRTLRSQSVEPGLSHHYSSTIVLKKTSKTSDSDLRLTRSRSLGPEMPQIIKTKNIVHSCPSTPQRKLRSQSVEPGHSQHCSPVTVLKKTSKTKDGVSKLKQSRSLGPEMSGITRTKDIVHSCPSTLQRGLCSRSVDPDHSQYCNSTTVLKKTTKSRSRSLGPEMSGTIRTKCIINSCPSTPQHQSRSQSVEPSRSQHCPKTTCKSNDNYTRLTRSRSLGPTDIDTFQNKKYKVCERYEGNKENTSVRYAESNAAEHSIFNKLKEDVMQAGLSGKRGRGRPKKSDNFHCANLNDAETNICSVLSITLTTEEKHIGTRKRDRNENNQKLIHITKTSADADTVSESKRAKKPHKIEGSRCSTCDVESTSSSVGRGRSRKREHVDNQEENIPVKVKRSMSLGPADVDTTPLTRKAKNPHKAEETRCKSLDMHEVESTKSSAKRGRPRRNERNENQEENMPVKSLAESLHETYHRNLKEKNVMLDKQEAENMQTDSAVKRSRGRPRKSDPGNFTRSACSVEKQCTLCQIEHRGESRSTRGSSMSRLLGKGDIRQDECL